MQVFLAMALYDVGEHGRAMEILLRNLAETNSDLEIAAYKRALYLYADRLNEAPWPTVTVAPQDVAPGVSGPRPMPAAHEKALVPQFSAPATCIVV